MTHRPVKNVQRVMRSGRALAAMAAHARRLERLNALFGAFLPPALQAHCRVANLSGGTLIVHGTSPAWTTRLRFEAPRLQRELAALPEFASVNEIRIRPAPTVPLPVPAPIREPARLSPRAAEHLRAVAATAGAPALRKALERLAGRASAPG